MLKLDATNRAVYMAQREKSLLPYNDARSTAHMKFMITGGAGFIGSAVVRNLVGGNEHEICVVDKLTYAADIKSLSSFMKSPHFAFEKVDVVDTDAVNTVIARHSPDIIIHLAAESHVDRSIDSPEGFIQTNIVGTFTLLQAALEHFRLLPQTRQKSFRFHHVSTDEVFGSLGPEGCFTERTPYDPSSPYSASKAASDHLVRAWGKTYQLPISISNCSNNYGPYQFPEKLIPLIIINAIEGKLLPVYGTGANIRDWLHVDDHAEALLTVATRGRPNETYNIGSNSERQNLDIVTEICTILDRLRPRSSGSYVQLITHVQDRPGHDMRYAIDATKLKTELGWLPSRSFEAGLLQTVKWYLGNADWWHDIRSEVYDGERLGAQMGKSVGRDSGQALSRSTSRSM
jgi:dTDP-glucose 4,6-dehydratase